MQINNMFYKLINFLVDKVTGYNINKACKEAIQFDLLSREEIEEYQRHKFKKLAEIASSSEFYIRCVNKKLSDFPLIDREIFQKEYCKMITKSKKSFKINSSSGSTGHPVKQYITKDMLLAKRASHQKMLHWYGLKRESPELKMGGIEIDIIKKAYYFMKNKKFFDSYNINNSTIQKISKVFNKFKPKILYGYPSTIDRFVTYARSNNIKLHHPEIIVVHAENLYKEMQDNFKSCFPDTKIVNQYWSTEANIAVTCPEGNLHIDENTVICEVLNKDANGIGDLYITNLFSYKVPIIRYKLGDRVKISEKHCPCGRNTKIIEFLSGRENEYLELPDGNKFPITAIHELNFAGNILCYQMVYKNRSSEILIKYVLIDDSKKLNEKAFSELIIGQLGITPIFEKVDEIKHSSGGKFKRLILID